MEFASEKIMAISQEGVKDVKALSGVKDVKDSLDVKDDVISESTMEEFKYGGIIHQIDEYEKEDYMFGRVVLCDLILEHTILFRFYVIILFSKLSDVFLDGSSSTLKISINKI
ncbi:uncharacterized protein LOC110925556 [Helianthus annuus]|uniref:uncharacterized protein LOC110925556 n=1 Tax=Helianthus annuus TaxID=4232 RepID=UPI000B8F1837|nr:uncharacterized protein LOC110925556 [Helianthus annuus]